MDWAWDLILTSGFSSYNDPILVRKPHDDYLEIYARLGLPSLLAFLSLLGTALWSICRRSRLDVASRERHFLVWVLANSFIYLFIAGTQPLLAYPFGTIPLFAALGAGLALSGRRSAEPPSKVADAATSRRRPARLRPRGQGRLVS